MNILFWETNGLHKFHFIPMILGHAAIRQKHRCQTILCDAVIPECDETSITIQKKTSLCQSCIEETSTAFNSAGIPVYKLSEFLCQNDINKIKKMSLSEMLETVPDYDNEFVRISENSIIRYYRGFPMDAEASSLRKRIICSGIITMFAAEKILQRMNPDVVVMQNGKLMMEAIPKIIFRRGGKRVVVWEGGLRKDTIAMSDSSDGGNDYVYYETWQEIKKKPLSNEEKINIEKLLFDRGKGVGTWEFAEQPRFKNVDLLSELGIPENRRCFPTISFLGNVSWDSSLFDGHPLFEGMHDWLKESLRYLKNKPVNVIVRPHPGESYSQFGQQIQTKTMLREAGLDSDGVYIIGPSYLLSSYDIIAASSAVFVYGSTIGLEAACQGKPVIVCAKRHYRGKGFTIDPKSRSHYQTILNDAIDGRLPLLSKKQVDVAKKYAYMVFLLASHDYLHTQKRYESNPEEFNVDDDPVVQFLYNGLLGNNHFISDRPIRF